MVYHLILHYMYFTLHYSISKFTFYHIVFDYVLLIVLSIIYRYSILNIISCYVMSYCIRLDVSYCMVLGVVFWTPPLTLFWPPLTSWDILNIVYTPYTYIIHSTYIIPWVYICICISSMLDYQIWQVAEAEQWHQLQPPLAPTLASCQKNIKKQLYNAGKHWKAFSYWTNTTHTGFLTLPVLQALSIHKKGSNSEVWSNHFNLWSTLSSWVTKVPYQSRWSSVWEGRLRHQWTVGPWP